MQYVIIEYVRNLHLPFPMNWLLLTASIIISAFLLHKICDIIYKTVDKVLRKNSEKVALTKGVS